MLNHLMKIEVWYILDLDCADVSWLAMRHSLPAENTDNRDRNIIKLYSELLPALSREALTRENSVHHLSHLTEKRSPKSILMPPIVRVK